jgi:ribosomal protein S18 acetylase RimI-like enzyme
MLADSLPEGYVHTDDGVTSVVTHSTIPLFNQVIVSDDSASERALESAIAVMGATGLRFAVSLRSGPEAFDDHIKAASMGFGMPREILDAVLVPQLAQREDLTVYAGYLDDQPVTSSLGFVDDGSISVFNVATVEEHRGKGYGAAMTMRAVLDGETQGCDVAFLQATEMGFPLYELLGFETIFTYELWGLPPA